MSKNPLSIEVLEALDAIDRRGSFAKAAEELNKATSAVSYVVQKLEEQLDIAVFQRQGRRSVLTPAGQLVLEEGREILLATTRLANKAKEVATGWEPRIRIGVELHQSCPAFFEVLHDFLVVHPSIEIDVCEVVLNGGWEALEHGSVELLLGSPGPVPAQKGYRAVALTQAELLPVMSSSHVFAGIATQPKALAAKMPGIRRVIAHDTSMIDVARSAGLSGDGLKFYVQNIDQKVEAILAGIGIGNLPRQRIQAQLDSGELIPLALPEDPTLDTFLAWKISNKGKGLKDLTQRLSVVFAQ
ncbi:MAG: LysR family transcriptional regulator [Pseudomonadales bacterium]